MIAGGEGGLDRLGRSEGGDQQLLPRLHRRVGIEAIGGGDGGKGHAIVIGDVEAAFADGHGVMAGARQAQALPLDHGIGRLEAIGLDDQHARHMGAIGDAAQRFAGLHHMERLALGRAVVVVILDGVHGFGVGFGCVRLGGGGAGLVGGGVHNVVNRAGQRGACEQAPAGKQRGGGHQQREAGPHAPSA